MTLFKQLFVSVSLVFLCLLAGIEVIYISNARTYLQEQLASHSQDAATSLGMVLPASMEKGDMVYAETTVAAVFDRGFYQSIRVITLHGETVVQKSLAPTPPGVPEWFTSLVKLEAPSAESMISKGWHQLGRVIVISHPNFAYRQLWRTTLGTSFWLMGLYFVCVLLLRGFLITILRPLEEIESVANAISERDFKLVSAKPKARELKSVVQAINSLSGKIRKIINDEVAAANYFRAEAYVDQLTKLDNRRSFESQIKPILNSSNDIGSGALYLIHIEKLKELNAAHGVNSGDKLLKISAAVLADVFRDHHGIRARISGATFAIAVFNLTKNEALDLGREIFIKLNQAIAAGKSAVAISFGCGGAYFEREKVTLGSLMAIADMAMLQSMHSGNAAPVLLDFKPETEDEKGSLFWKTLILDSLATDKIALLAQPVIAFDGNTRLQYEVIGRLIGNDGELIVAGKFMPMAIRHDLAAAVDKKLIERFLHVLLEKPHLTDQFAINLSVRSIHDADLMDWLLPALENQPGIARKIVFEFAEFGVVQNLPSLEKFVLKTRKLGVGFAVDNFGLHSSAFEYLQALRPEYIKLSSTFIADLPSNSKNQLFIASVANITHPLEIKTIAHGVENTDTFKLLEKLGVDGYQGFVTGSPIRID